MHHGKVNWLEVQEAILDYLPFVIVFCILLLGTLITGNPSLKLTLHNPIAILTSPFVYDGWNNWVDYGLFFGIFFAFSYFPSNMRVRLKIVRKNRVVIASLLMIVVGICASALWWFFGLYLGLNFHISKGPGYGQSGIVAAALGLLVGFLLANMKMATNGATGISYGLVAVAVLVYFVQGYTHLWQQYFVHWVSFGIGAFCAWLWYKGYEEKALDSKLKHKV